MKKFLILSLSLFITNKTYSADFGEVPIWKQDDVKKRQKILKNANAEAAKSLRDYNGSLCLKIDILDEESLIHSSAYLQAALTQLQRLTPEQIKALTDKAANKH